MALKKGSAAAKAFMANLRAARGKKKIAGKKPIFVLSPEEQEFVKQESKNAKGFTYRWKILRGEDIVLKEQNGAPVQKFYVDDIDVGKKIADLLNRAAKKTTSIPAKAKKVGYKSDRTNFLKLSTKLIPKYKAKGYTRKEAVRNANIDAAFVSGSVKKAPVQKMHKDTKSHNVNISVVSGTKKYSMGKVNYTTLLTQIGKESKLKAAVVRSIKAAAKNYGKGSDAIKNYVNDVISSGGQSGIISELIYYTDTKAWFKKYNSDISILLKEFISDMGVNSPAELFGNKWDRSDMFATDTQNQNLLAWFSYEETCNDIAQRLGFFD